MLPARAPCSRSAGRSPPPRVPRAKQRGASARSSFHIDKYRVAQSQGCCSIRNLPARPGHTATRDRTGPGGMAQLLRGTLSTPFAISHIPDSHPPKRRGGLFPHAAQPARIPIKRRPALCHAAVGNKNRWGGCPERGHPAGIIHAPPMTTRRPAFPAGGPGPRIVVGRVNPAPGNAHGAPGDVSSGSSAPAPGSR